MYQNYLPVGSVVMLKGADKKLAIIGRIVAPNTGSEIFDYAACPFPQGLTDANQFYVFDSNQIERVYFIGFQDPEELELQEYLSGLGELYITESGNIAERGKEEAAPKTDEIEVPVFADVD